MMQNESYPTCPNALRAFNAHADVIRIGCNQWKCPVCRSRLSHHWAERVRYGIALWPDPCKRHWTLTLPGRVQTAEFGFRILPACWDNLRKRVQRSHGTWDYAAFVELHPHREGIAHFHVISLAKSPARLKDVAHHAGFGYMATDDPVSGKEAAEYVSKYTSKQGAQMPKGFRRVRLSRLWPALPDPLYDVAIYPLLARESIVAYLHRIADITGVDYGDIKYLWSSPDCDII